MYRVRRPASINQPRAAPFAIHSAIFAFTLPMRSLGEVNSTTKSGHRGGNCVFCFVVKPARRLLCTQEASGASAAPFGRRYSVLESRAIPRPSRIDQTPSWVAKFEL